VPAQSTWLYTLLKDSRAVATVDSQSAVETDLTGLTSSALAAGVGFFALVAADPLGELRAFRQSRTGWVRSKTVSGDKPFSVKTEITERCQCSGLSARPLT
jgi:hypothetical protein